MRKIVLALAMLIGTVGFVASPAEAHRTPYTKGNCAEMERYIRKAGLPVSFFMRIGKRESNCNNSALNHNRNGSHDNGWFQINSVHNGAKYLRQCGVYLASQLRGASVAAKQAQICVVKKLYRIAGTRPWRATR